MNVKEPFLEASPVIHYFLFTVINIIKNGIKNNWTNREIYPYTV